MALPTLDRAMAALEAADLQARHGKVRNLIGLVVEATGLQAQVGELCHIDAGRGRKGGRGPIPAEVVGFRDGATLLMPLGALEGIGPGSAVTATGSELRIEVGDELLGRVVDG